jgi:hypothetical protein
MSDRSYECSHVGSFPRNATHRKQTSCRRGVGITKLDDWYQLGDKAWNTAVEQLFGSQATGEGSVLVEALLLAYLEHDWLPWKFGKRVPTGYWQDKNNHRKFFDWLSVQLDIKSKEEWYLFVLLLGVLWLVGSCLILR